MDIILPDVRLVTTGEQVILLDVWARGVRVAQRGFDVLVRQRLVRLLVQKLVNIPAWKRDILLRLLVSFGFPKDQECQKVGLNHIVEVPPDFRLQRLILAFQLEALQELGRNLLRLRNEFHRFNRVFLIMERVVRQDIIHQQSPLPRINSLLVSRLKLKQGQICLESFPDVVIWEIGQIMLHAVDGQRIWNVNYSLSYLDVADGHR